MKIGDKVKSINRESDHGKIVKIWWDGTIRVQWSDGYHSLCNVSDIVIISWNGGRHPVVRFKV